MPSLTMGLTYYTPYVSGLTNVARDIAQGLVSHGWDVTVVATRHDLELPSEELVEGVRVIRARTVANLGKGAISPALPHICVKEMRRAGLGLLHLPMLEAGVIAKLLGADTPLVTAYHCDVSLPGSLASRAIEGIVDRSTRCAIGASQRVAVTSMDYAASSRVAGSLRSKAVEIPPPTHARSIGTPTFRDGAGPHVGFLGRIVEEKGVPGLVDAFRRVAGPEWRLLLGGDYERVAGGSTIRAVRASVRNDPRVRVLGFIPDERIADFYASLDVFAFPSVNPLEAFGIAQAEAMLAGVPVVASDMPGVRQPVLRTGFGRLVPPGDAQRLGDALTEVLNAPQSRWRGCRDRALQEFALAGVIARWEETLADAR